METPESTTRVATGDGTDPTDGDDNMALTEQFYDGLAGDYHLLFSDWDASRRRQALVLEKLIGRYTSPVVWAGPRGAVRLLDCAAGIGTQALGLAGLGFTVVATDLSGAAVRRAEAEAESMRLLSSQRSGDGGGGGGLEAVAAADFREVHAVLRREGIMTGGAPHLSPSAAGAAAAAALSAAPVSGVAEAAPEGVAAGGEADGGGEGDAAGPASIADADDRFHAVIAFDNALPHLLEDEDIVTALRSMGRCLRPGGVLLLSIRDYDALVETKPSGTTPYRSGEGGYGFQVWDWYKLPNGADAYDVQMFLVRPTPAPATAAMAADASTVGAGGVAGASSTAAAGAGADAGAGAGAEAGGASGISASAEVSSHSEGSDAGAGDGTGRVGGAHGSSATTAKAPSPSPSPAPVSTRVGGSSGGGGGDGGGDVWSAVRHTAVYRALKQAELVQLLRRAGYRQVWVHAPEATGFYQPVFAATL